MSLVYLSPVPWESFAQRPHKFVPWFHRRTDRQVIWADPYPTRFPNWRDLDRSRVSASPSQLTSAPPWLTVVKPRALPIEPVPGSGHINGLFWREQFQTLSNYAKKSQTLLAIGKPSVLALTLLEALPHRPSIYDAMDDFPAFYSGLSRLALSRREQEIVRRVGIMLVSSSELRSRWMHRHNDVRLTLNGLDSLAIRAVEAAPRDSGKIIFGYVGTIASWFDWDWICALADARQHDEIRLIGPVYNPPDRNLPSNISLLPACNHAQALHAMTRFHVGLIPFKRNALTASVDPIKYYEYRALGLPIISTAFGEMALREGHAGLLITQSLDNLPSVADAAIQLTGDVRYNEQFVSDNSWEARFDAANLLQ
jgi:hypothetical protein